MPDDGLRIEVLTLLEGVSWSTASALLHYGYHEPYQILDFRALWSLGMEMLPVYNFNLWRGYIQVCRKLATEAKIYIRTLDWALWQYAKKKQNPI